MSQHILNVKPAVMFMDGKEWVPKEHLDAATAALREKQRSTQSHNHHFAAIHDLWANLPHTHADAPYAASPEAFRKHCLIGAGYCDVETIDCETQEIAKRVAPVVAAKARKADGYAVVTVRGPLVICRTPHSQSYKAMGKDVFNKSKAESLAYGEVLLGVER